MAADRPESAPMGQSPGLPFPWLAPDRHRHRILAGVDAAQLRALLSAPFTPAAPVSSTVIVDPPAMAAPIGSDDARDLAEGPLVPCAVLVPFLLGGAEPGVLLTKRTSHLNQHAGQVAFPGGRIDPGDADPEAAALR